MVRLKVLIRVLNLFSLIEGKGVTPCPPYGQTHRYSVKIYGPDCQLSLPAGSTKDRTVKAMAGHVVQ
ncbi:MAG: hypothetical protein Q8R70_08955 [Methanoregula sp.]|nr:hypothetical protein [Methanoregula sp.]